MKEVLADIATMGNTNNSNLFVQKNCFFCEECNV